MAETTKPLTICPGCSSRIPWPFVPDPRIAEGKTAACPQCGARWLWTVVDGQTVLDAKEGQDALTHEADEAAGGEGDDGRADRLGGAEASANVTAAVDRLVAAARDGAGDGGPRMIELRLRVADAVRKLALAAMSVISNDLRDLAEQVDAGALAAGVAPFDVIGHGVAELLGGRAQLAESEEVLLGLGYARATEPSNRDDQLVVRWLPPAPAPAGGEGRPPGLLDRLVREHDESYMDGPGAAGEGRACGVESPERSCTCRLPAGHDGAHEGERGPGLLSSWAGGEGRESACEDCDGSGECPACGGLPGDQGCAECGSYHGRCRGCSGSGYVPAEPSGEGRAPREAVAYEVRIDRQALYRVLDMPGLARIDLDESKIATLTFETAPGCDPAGLEYITGEVQRMTGGHMLHAEAREVLPAAPVEDREGRA